MKPKANKEVICDQLMERAKTDRDLLVLCSDSRGSASLAPFADAYPDQFIETGIAEQNLVSIAAGLARCGKRPFVASPACFLSTRSMEQAKIDVAYSKTNVKLIGISGGISYGALGLTHHSTQDIAVFTSMPGMRVYFPSDAALTEALLQQLIEDDTPAYIRVGRNPVETVYENGVTLEQNKAVTVKEGTDAALIACGEMVYPALQAAKTLEKEGISVRVLDMYCLKPIDQEAVLKAAQTGVIVTVEEHCPYGGLGSMVAQIVAENGNATVKCLSLPDEPAVAGTSKEVFHLYGLDAEHIAAVVKERVKK